MSSRLPPSLGPSENSGSELTVRPLTRAYILMNPRVTCLIGGLTSTIICDLIRIKTVFGKSGSMNLSSSHVKSTDTRNGPLGKQVGSRIFGAGKILMVLRARTRWGWVIDVQFSVLSNADFLNFPKHLTCHMMCMHK